MENGKSVMLEVFMPDAADGSSLKINEDLRVHVRLIPPEGAQIDCAVNKIDVIVLGTGLCGRIKPLRRSLPLPPKADAVAEFIVNADKPGTHELEILLLIRNEAIHHMKYFFTAI